MAFTGIRERLGTGVYTPLVEAKVADDARGRWAARRGSPMQAGVPVVFGTDAAVYPHGRNAEEFAQLVELRRDEPGRGARRPRPPARRTCSAWRPRSAGSRPACLPT